MKQSNIIKKNHTRFKMSKVEDQCDKVPRALRIMIDLKCGSRCYASC